MKKNNIVKSVMTGLMAVVMVGSMSVGFKKETVKAADVPQKRIVVNGQGAIKVKPDMAYIYFAVETNNKDVKVAQKDNAKSMDSVMKAIKAFGVAEKDIATSGFNVYPQYDYSTNKSVLVGYTVSNSITVTTKDVNKIGELLDIGVNAGATRVNNVQLTISDTSAYYSQALEMAVKNADVKANALAKALKVKITGVLDVLEFGGNYMPISYANYSGKQEAMAMDSVGGVISPIQIGDLEVTASIQVTYLYQ